MSRLSTVARSSFSPARNVFSTVAPVFTFLSRVLTNADPLPGLTCKNSITVHSWPFSKMVTPLRRSFDEIMTWPNTHRKAKGPVGTVAPAKVRTTPAFWPGGAPLLATNVARPGRFQMRIAILIRLLICSGIFGLMSLPASAPAAPAPPAGAGAGPPSGPAAYADFVKGAQVLPGLIPIVKKDGKLYLALSKDQIGADFI